METQQVNKEAYAFDKYCPIDRWSSYWHQIDEVIKANPSSMLEIGLGDKVLANYLKNNTTIKYSSFDVAVDLKPDIVGSIDNMSIISDNSYDLVCAFEVIEHLPYERFKIILGELKRISQRWVIISLPHWGRHFSVNIRLPYFKKFHWQKKISFFPKNHFFNGQHHWEIGKRGFDLGKIKEEINNSGFEIITDYIAFESPYHHFFILKKIEK